MAESDKNHVKMTMENSDVCPLQTNVDLSLDSAATAGHDCCKSSKSKKAKYGYNLRPISVNLKETSAHPKSLIELDMCGNGCQPNAGDLPTATHTAPVNIEMAGIENTGHASSECRRMPTRASKKQDTFVNDIQQPAKRKLPVKLTPKPVAELYKVQTLNNFYPTRLETIFEVPEYDDSQQYELFGRTKIRRSLDLLNKESNNKTVISKRRAKIKKVFPNKKRRGKVSMDAFLKRFGAVEAHDEAPSCDEQHNSNLSVTPEHNFSQS